MKIALGLLLALNLLTVWGWAETEHQRRDLASVTAMWHARSVQWEDQAKQAIAAKDCR